jgi:menaquinone-specific isochorismate synthase
VVPRRIVGRDAEGRGWVTEIGPRTAEGPPGRATGRRPARERDASPTELAVRERMTRAEWHDAVDAALDAIARGDLEKVVLARRVDVEADRPFDARAVLGRLQVDQPGCFVYAVDGMLGASPELLVRRVGVAVESRPMAGTSVTLDDAALEELARSSKDAREHRPVVNAIVDALTPWCERLLVAAEPEVARFASVAHLATPIRGTLREPAPDAAAIAIALHPTPAVGGTPTDAALAMIRSLEPCGRDRYAGPVGWVDAHGDGEWVVALRGAAIDGTRAVLHAGAGIVAGSVPDDEWRETEAKLEPMMRALVLERRPLAGALSATPR